MDPSSAFLAAAGGAVIAIEYASGSLQRSVARIRKPSRPLIDVLPYRHLVADGVLSLTRGRLQATWEVIGDDLTAADVARYSRYLAPIHTAFVKGRDANDGSGDLERWQFNFSTPVRAIGGYIAGPSSTEHLDPTSATLAWARRRRFEARGHHFLTRTFLTATYTPESRISSAVERFAFDGDEDDDDDVDVSGSLGKFERGAAAIQDTLSAHVYELRRLRGRRVGAEVYDDQLGFVKSSLEGRECTVIQPPIGSSVQRILAVGDYLPVFEPRLGDNYIKVISIEDFPDKSYPGDFDFLGDLECELWHETRAVFVSPQVAFARHKRQREELITLSISLGDRLQGKKETDAGVAVDHVKAAQAQQQEDHMGEISMGALRHCEWTSVVILIGPNLPYLRRTARRIRDRINRQYTARIEGPNAWEAFMGARVGDDRYNRSPYLIDSIQLVDTVQLSRIDPGPIVHPNPMMSENSPVLTMMLSHGRSAVRMVDSVGDNMHQLIIGPTGSSKTSLALAQCAWGLQQYPDELQFIFDQGGSAERYARAVGASFNRLDPSNQSGFAVFDGIEDEMIRYERLAWLEATFRANGRLVSPKESKTLWDALTIHARSAKRSMSLFQGQLGVLNPELAAVLEYYTASGPLGYLLDAEKDRFSDARVHVFEMQRLMQAKDERAIAPVLLYIFDRIRRVVREKGAKGRMLIDEPKDYFRHPVLGAAFEDQLDKARKQRVGVMITTLAPSDLLAWPIGKTVASACATHIVLGTMAAAPGELRGDNTREHAGAQYESFTALGYSDEDCSKIASLPRYRFMLRQGEATNMRRAVVQADPDPVELLFWGATSTVDQAETTAFRRGGHDWPAALLEAKGHREAASYWRTYAAKHAWCAPEDEVSTEVAYAH